MASTADRETNDDGTEDARIGENEPALSESELDEYIISLPDLSKKRQQTRKHSNQAASNPATPRRNESVTSIASMASQRHASNSPAKSQASASSEEAAGPSTPRRQIGWLGTDARVWSKGFASPGKTSSLGS